MVSICIPTFNKPHYLRDAIDSVIKQSYKNIEIIVYDDCSTVEIKNIISSFADSRIKYYRSEVNFRPPVSWNKCIENANGRLIILLPHDDILLEGYIERVVGEYNNDCNVGFIQVNFLNFYDNSIAMRGRLLSGDVSLIGVQALKWQLDNMRCCPATICINASRIRISKFWDEEYWDDWVAYIDLGYKYGFRYIDVPYAGIRDHSDNLSKSIGKKRYGQLYLYDQIINLQNKIKNNDRLLLENYFNRKLILISLSFLLLAIKRFIRFDILGCIDCLNHSNNVYPRYYYKGIFYVDFLIKILFIKKFINTIKNNYNIYKK